MKSKQVTLIDSLRRYLKTRKTPVSVDKIPESVTISRPTTSVTRTLRTLVERGEAEQVSTRPCMFQLTR